MKAAALLRAASVLLVAAPAFGPSLAFADVVVHDGGVGRDKDAAARAEEHSGQRPARVLADDVLAGPSRPLASDLTLESCEGDAIPFEPGPRVDALTEAVLGFDLEAADGILSELRTLLSCSSTVVPARTLARVAFLEGALRYDQGVPEQAAVAMADAAVVDGDYPGERGFPAAHLELLSAARDGLQAGRLSVWPGPDVSAVYADGQPVDRAGSQGIELGRGLHLIQVETDDGLRGHWVRTRAAESTLVMPGAGRSVWRAMGSGPGADAGLSLMLQDEFGGRAGDVHVLQYRGRNRYAVTWPAGGGPLAVWDEAAAEAPSKRQPKAGTRAARSTTKAKAGTASGSQDDARRLRLAVGGGWQFVDPFHYALINIDVGVRVVGPLEIGAIARPSFGGVHEFPTPAGADEVVGPLFFVPFGGYAAVRKTGAISPWVGVAGHVAWNQDRLISPEWLGGVTAIGGIDLAPADDAFFLRIEGEAGFLWEAFTGRFAVAAGLRL